MEDRLIFGSERSSHQSSALIEKFDRLPNPDLFMRAVSYLGGCRVVLSIDLAITEFGIAIPKSEPLTQRPVICRIWGCAHLGGQFSLKFELWIDLNASCYDLNRLAYWWLPSNRKLRSPFLVKWIHKKVSWRSQPSLQQRCFRIPRNGHTLTAIVHT